MASNNFAVADQASESFPDYVPQLQDSYIDGYEPNSLSAPHSSLERASTWIGMGIVLSSLSGFGIMIWMAATIWSGQGVAAAEYDVTFYLIIGAVTAVVLVGLGFGLIHRGRRNYRAYVATTGRKN